MSFEESIALLPQWVQLWMNWMLVATVLGILVPLIFRASRRDGLVVLGANVVAFVLIQLLFNWLGFVRLLGLSHIVAFTPLAIYLWRRLRQGEMHRASRIALWVYEATIVISLIFDYIDAVRYIIGERGPIV